ncbi:mechanosensitive ion channel family protein [Actibacterium sp. XHP0104]|uniref:mechanosensitive ion channel family protein n=1 Tax=Actibacterium sp. XHP0104 TaxID=2984335 RepID=UPI0021E7FFF9|nr:mechanosensitive ion channel domain-containing protein [Actibacterium sp. XHP0104]MCV2881654.1 mechanosensitive ion channel [Actibacterium sp. XHP0104]
MELSIAEVEVLIKENLPWVIQLGLNLVTAVLILIVALWLSGRVRRRITNLPKKHKRFDTTLMAFLGSLAKYTVLAIAAIFILNRFGIETTSLVALIGAAGLAVGLALQGTLANLAAGVMLVGFRPFKLGDYVIAGGETGTVATINLFFTELTTPDNIQIIVPNGDIWGAPITNYSYNDTRRCDMLFGVSYGSNLQVAEQAIRDCIAAEPRALGDPQPFIKVSNLGDSSVDFTVRVWCKKDDYWDMKFDLTRAVKEAFDKTGVDIPFPTQIMIRQEG